MRGVLLIFGFYFLKAECILWSKRVVYPASSPKDYALTVQNVLMNEYVYPYLKLYDQHSNEYYKDPYSVQNLRNENMEPPQPEANPIKVPYNAALYEVHKKYLNSPKQIHKNDRYKSLDDMIEKLKLTIRNPKTPKKKKILFGEIIKTYNKYKDGEHNDYEPNAYIEQLMEIYLDPRTPKIYKKIYEEIISTYYRNRDLLERTYNKVNILEDDVNNQFDSEKYNYNPDSKEYESEKDLNDYGIDMLGKRNPRSFVKGLKALFSKINNSSTTTPAPLNSPLSQLPQTRDTSKQLLIATTTELPFTNKSKETDKLKNITEVLQKLNLNIEKQNKLPANIFQNLYSRIAQQNHMNTDKKGHIRFKRDLNSENNDAKESIITNWNLKKKVTENSKKINFSEAKDGSKVNRRADGAEEPAAAAGATEEKEAPPVKTKLIVYISDMLTEMTKKIQPITKLKEPFLSNSMFKIGYIIANIDTIHISIKKLKIDMDDNKESWDDQAAMDVFDKVMITNKILQNLMVTLQLNTRFNETNMAQSNIQKELYLIGLPETPKILL